MKKRVLGVIFLIVIAVIVIMTWPNSKPTFNITSRGFANYNNLKPILVNETTIESDSMIVKKGYLVGTDGKNIPYLLRFPANVTDKIPGIVFMPGAEVGKEYEKGIGTALTEKGFAIITIDQPGTNENTQQLMNQDQELITFKAGGEPSGMLFVSDYLLAYEYLKQQSFIDENRILLAGESNGGRIAIISSEILTSNQEKVKGLILISTAGYGLPEVADQTTTNYLRMIDPDYYAQYAGANSVMFQSTQDKVISMDSAQRTFNRLPQEKEFVLIPCKQHGSCPEAYDLITSKALKLIS
ncbi:Serine aminopeptidase, S33 [uncultured archaeon]|nr:Serine aminopeptidase, S33 [uncultured archaeon]